VLGTIQSQGQGAATDKQDIEEVEDFEDADGYYAQVQEGAKTGGP